MLVALSWEYGIIPNTARNENNTRRIYSNITEGGQQGIGACTNSRHAEPKVPLALTFTRQAETRTSSQHCNVASTNHTHNTHVYQVHSVGPNTHPSSKLTLFDSYIYIRIFATSHHQNENMQEYESLVASQTTIPFSGIMDNMSIWDRVQC